MNKETRIVLTAALVFFFLANIAFSQTPPNKEKQIDFYVRSFISATQIAGLAIAVVENDQITIAKAYGVKNLETMEPVTTKSIFHMASVSKTFAATAIMQLVEKGKIILDDPLIQYLPYFRLNDPRYKDITIRQMLSHTSGIPDEDDYEWEKPQFDDGAAERYVRSLVDEKMVATPGSKEWHYSNMAYDILADVIAKVSRTTFEDYVKKNILEPLDMKESDFLLARIKPELRTTPHVWYRNILPKAYPIYPYNRRHAPSSTLNSNILEMCNWATANMNRGAFKGKIILKESSYSAMFAPHAKIDENQSMGLGWFLGSYRGLKMISHAGGDEGYRSYLAMFPEKSLAVLFVGNSDYFSRTELLNGMTDVMLGLAPKPIKARISLVLAHTIISRDVQKAIEQYRDLKKNRPDAYDFSEGELCNLGFKLLNSNRLDEAVKIVNLNLEFFPVSAETYWLLAEVYQAKGLKELAIENYKKALEISPNHDKAKEALLKLKK